MKIMKKSLAMLLVLCMLVSMVPLNVFAASATGGDGAVVTETEGTENDFIKVFHLDCGRKYFTVDQVKELIDSISNVGFSHMELAIGNDGLRLLLDDMSIDANGTTYSSETIKSGIKAGNSGYSHSGEWTQADMDAIISYAATKGIEIIPLVNNPGHMDSILAAMKACDINGYYKSSARTVDLENAEAVAFTQALVMKYAEYFAGKGCEYFNIGADEYANDYHTADSTGMGFGYLIDNNKYGNFVTYVNDLVAKICELDMTPIAFNDGIYFRENTSFGTFDNRLMIASWSGGWGGIKPASTTFLANKGHKILNTNERWYYVLGRSQSVNGTYCYESALSNAKSESVTTVTDHTSVTPMGAMQCVWCDDPSVDYETYKSNVMTLINTMAENNPTYFTGPNEPLAPETVTKTDEETGITVTAPGLVGLTIAEAEAPKVEGAAQGKVLAWDITPTTEEGNYSGEAEVSVPVPADWIKVRGGVLASDNGEEVTGIKGKLENGMFTFTVPHFSTAVVYEVGYDELVELTVGETSQVYTDNSGYHTVAEGLNTSIATATLSGNAGSAATVKYTEADVSCNALISSNSDSWIATEYYYKNGENYYPLYAKRSGNNTRTFTWGYSTTASSSDVKQISTQRVNQYYVSYTEPNITVYTKSGTEAVPATTTVSFTGVSVGTTYATVGETVYKIVVGKKTESITLTVGDTKTYADNSTSVPVVEDSSVVDAAIANGNLTITAKTKGTTTVTTDNAVYTINVVEFDPSAVTPLTVEYWITNIVTRTVDSTTDTPVTTQQISAAANGVVTAEGADINAMMPKETIKRDGDSGADREVEFWHVRLLDKTQTNNSTSGTEEQTTESADDETTNGNAVTRVRYYDPDGNGRRWQMLAGTTWMDVDYEDNQIVAYYMEVVDLMKESEIPELHVKAADWGKLGDNSPASSYADTNKYCSISVQIIYEDGSGNPATTTVEDLDSKTIIYNYWDNGRGIGTFAFDTLGQFNIYQITAETGAVDVTFSGGAWGTAQVKSFSWDENEKVVWSGESETASVYNNTSHPSSEDPKDNLMWNENKEAILLRVYVKAVETEDSLNVVYIDEKFNDTLYSYNIQVEKDHNFNKNMIGTSGSFENGRINVTGCGIENVYGQTQNFQTDLTKVPEAKGKYNSDLYKYTGSTISEDGKTLYLYYTINPSAVSPMFVADYGRPFTFSLSHVVKEGIETVDDVTVNGNTRYGTLSYNASSKEFTYTPTQVLPNIDVLTINIKFDGDTTYTTTNAGVLPATTVDYEEGFATLTGFTGGSRGTAMQNAWVAGTNPNNDVYGYDGKVVTENNTCAVSTAKGNTAEFTFTGRGVDLYVNSKEKSGNIAVQVRDANDDIVKLYSVKTTSNSTITKDSDLSKDQNGLIAVSLMGLDYGQYTVIITTTAPNDDGVYFDGFRVYGTIENHANEYYVDDEEANAMFIELRDAVLTAVNAKTVDSIYKKGSEIYKQVHSETTNLQGALVLGDNKELSTKDLLDNGPKNELFLLPGDTVNFNLGSTYAQVGMKSISGSTSYEMIYDEDGDFDTKTDQTTKTDIISTSTDMFYEEGVTGAVTIKNTGNTILSITQLKIFGVASPAEDFTFEPISEEQITFALRSMAGLPAEEPGTPDTPVEPQPGTPTPEPGTPETPAPEPGTPEPAPEPGKPDPKPAHQCTMKEEIKPATTKKDGKIVVKCTECGEVESTTVIYKASNVKLSKNEFVYNGKVKSPKLTIKDSKGNTIAKKYYSVSKPAGRKDVGKYTYTIKFKGLYEGTKKLTLTVKPKATSVKKVTASKKAFTVKWNKVSKQATGYEIMYATNAKFSKGKKTVKVTKLNTTSKKISKLKAKQKYYVKVRTYKTVKVNGKKTNIYSAWSSPKTITVKK